MKISITTVAYCLPESIRAQAASLEAASRDHELHLDLFVASPFPDVLEVCDSMAVDVMPWQYHRYCQNVGLSVCWNRGIISGYLRQSDLVIVVNDDIVFGPGSIDEWVYRATRHFEENPNAIVYTAIGKHGVHGDDVPLGYSAFIYSKRAPETVGLFDPNFLFTYCEDCDFTRRAELLGLDACSGGRADIWHGGSQSVRGSQDASGGLLDARIARVRERSHQTHRANQNYYRQKWGCDAGDPATGDGAKGMRYPFGDPRIPLRIAPDDHSSPYGEWGWNRDYDRDVLMGLEQSMVYRPEGIVSGGGNGGVK